jgi:hypothetical protein
MIFMSLVNIIKRYLTNNDCYKANKTIKVKGLMIHSVGTPQPKASVFINTWDKPYVLKCVHGFIEPDGDAHITLPCMETPGTAMRAWHCGKGTKGSGNDTHLGFEMTEPSTIKYTGGSSFQDLYPEATREHVKGTYNTAVQLFADLCRFHKLNPLADGVIISHSEGHQRGIASNHGDVEHMWKKYGYSMEQFRKDIKEAMGETVSTPETPKVTSKEYKVKVLVDGLNYRKGPGVLHKRMGTITDRGIYTIVDESKGWGKLKSGAGWINLKYTHRLSN